MVSPLKLEVQASTSEVEIQSRTVWFVSLSHLASSFIHLIAETIKSSNSSNIPQTHPTDILYNLLVISSPTDPLKSDAVALKKSQPHKNSCKSLCLLVLPPAFFNGYQASQGSPESQAVSRTPSRTYSAPKGRMRPSQGMPWMAPLMSPFARYLAIYAVPALVKYLLVVPAVDG